VRRTKVSVQSVKRLETNSGSGWNSQLGGAAL